MSNTTNYHIPNDRFYDGETHLWVQMNPETGRLVVGLDAFGLDSFGELAYIDIKEVGTAVRRGEPVGTLEAAKMTGEIISPVSGILIGRNELVLRDPISVNYDPYGKGWLFSLDPSDWQRESAALISGEAIEAWIAGEVEKMKSQGLLKE